MSGPRGRLHELDGERLTLREWAERFGVDLAIVKVRVSTGWRLRDALTRPVGKVGGARVARNLGPSPEASKRIEPDVSVADLRIEAAIRDLRAQVVMRATP